MPRCGLRGPGSRGPGSRGGGGRHARSRHGRLAPHCGQDEGSAAGPARPVAQARRRWPGAPHSRERHVRLPLGKTVAQADAGQVQGHALRQGGREVAGGEVRDARARWHVCHACKQAGGRSILEHMTRLAHCSRCRPQVQHALHALHRLTWHLWMVMDQASFSGICSRLHCPTPGSSDVKSCVRVMGGLVGCAQRGGFGGQPQGRSADGRGRGGGGAAAAAAAAQPLSAWCGDPWRPVPTLPAISALAPTFCQNETKP